MPSYSRFASLKNDPFLKVPDWSPTAGPKTWLAVIFILLISIFSCSGIQRARLTPPPSGSEIENGSSRSVERVEHELPAVRGL